MPTFEELLKNPYSIKPPNTSTPSGPVYNTPPSIQTSKIIPPPQVAPPSAIESVSNFIRSSFNALNLTPLTKIGENLQQGGVSKVISSYLKDLTTSKPEDIEIKKLIQQGNLSEAEKLIGKQANDLALGFIGAADMNLVSKPIINAIAKETSISAIKNYLKKLNVPKAIWQDLSEKLVKVTKPTEVENIISQSLKTFQKAQKATSVASDLQPLAQEARKYKSAEEFVKAQGTRTGVEVRDKIGTKLQDPYTAEYLPTNSDGTITLYHSTTKEGAEKIKQSGIFGSKTEGGDIYFTTNKKGYGGIGKDKDVVLAFNVDPKKIKFDDVYRGELHLKGNNTDIGGIKPVVIKTKSQLTDIYNQATKGTQATDLLSEARKYKSAEEFVKAQGTPTFSGGSQITKEWSNEKLGGFGTIFRGRNELGGGIYITDSPEYAKTFGSQLTESSLKKNLKLLDIRESSKAIGSAELNKIKKGFESYESYLKNGGEELLPTDYPDEVLNKIQNVYGGNSTDILKKAGFEGIVADESRIGGQGGTVWNIFNANNLKTKSQLTEIWNKANDGSKVEPLIAEARKYKSAEEFYSDIAMQMGEFKSKSKAGNDFNYLKELVSDRDISDFLKFGEYKFDEGILRGKVGAGQELIQGKVAHWKDRISKGERPIIIIEDKPYISKVTEGSRNYDAILEARVRQGHSRLEAYRQLGIKKVPVVYKSQLTDIWNKAVKTASELPSKLGQKIPQVEKKLLSTSPLKVGQEITPELLRVQPIQTALKVGKSYLDDATKIAKSKLINTDNLLISDEAKGFVNTAIDGIKPELEKITGKVLTNKEVSQIADKSSSILKNVVGVEQTKAWEASMFNLRRRLAQQAQTGVVTKQFLDDLAVVKTQGTDIARKLQSLGMKASPEDKTLMNLIIEKILQTGANADDVLKASQGVDFNDFKQASEFYRKWIAPKFTEWLDLLRYNSMLSSPLTHIVNTVSNIGQTLIVAPLEKLALGSIDFIKSSATGSPRKYLASEVPSYLNGYFKNIGEGFKRFTGVMKGERAFTQLDLKAIPVATKGVRGKIADTLSYPMKLLEGMDQFFTALTQEAEEAGMAYRASRGIRVSNIEAKAGEMAKYRLFRQGLFNENQGAVLDAIDTVTNKLMGFRNSKNPIISTISKFTIPFIQTPTNIFKQGIEYSPLGFSTAIGAKNAQEQIAKAVVGSAVFGAGATLLASGRITGQEPIDATNRQLWRQAGKQAYSVKVGNKWVSYQKLPPAFSFPLSMVAILSDLEKNKTSDSTFTDMFLTGISKEFQFLSDQSYAKSIGDFMSAIQGGEYAIQRLISNYPQQLIPFRALTGWMARLSDASQRQVDAQTFIEKQVQLLMMNYPGLSQLTPARLDKKGNPIPNQNRFFNAVSPLRVQQEIPYFVDFLNSSEDIKKLNKENQIQSDKAKAKVKPIYDQVQELIVSGNEAEAQKIVNGLSEEDYAVYKKIKSSEKTKLTTKAQVDLFPTFQNVQNLLSQGKIEEAQSIINAMSDDEYRIYKILKGKFSQ